MESRMTSELEAQALGESLKAARRCRPRGTRRSPFSARNSGPSSAATGSTPAASTRWRTRETTSPAAQEMCPWWWCGIASNEITAFVNVCRHRGAEIVPDGSRGNRNTLQCHYHAWTWGLDGRLRAAPGSEDEPCFRKEDFPLTPLEVAVLGPFVFVKPDPQAPGWDGDGRRASP